MSRTSLEILAHMEQLLNAREKLAPLSYTDQLMREDVEELKLAIATAEFELNEFLRRAVADAAGIV